MRRWIALRDGSSLVESMVSIILVSVVLLGLVPGLFHAVERQRRNAMGLVQSSVLQGESSRLMAMPFAQLDAAAGCMASTAPGHFPHELCVRVEAPTATERQVVVRVAADTPILPPDSIVLTRTSPSTATPFHTGLQP